MLWTTIAHDTFTYVYTTKKMRYSGVSLGTATREIGNAVTIRRPRCRMAGTSTLVECRAEFAHSKAIYAPVLRNKGVINPLWVAFIAQNTAVKRPLGGMHI